MTYMVRYHTGIWYHNAMVGKSRKWEKNGRVYDGNGPDMTARDGYCPYMIAHDGTMW